MIYVSIDVAKDKHDCFITNSDGEVLFNVFSINANLKVSHLKSTLNKSLFIRREIR